MKISIYTIILLCSTTVAYSFENSFENRGTFDSNRDNSYESSLGNKYEYDMTDPGDRIKYNTDIAVRI